jgi:hypothetical protein
VNYGKRFIVLVCCAVAVFCVVPLLLRPNAVQGKNDGSRWNTVWSLTHGKQYAIDDAPYETQDKVYNHGHWYSTKPALLPAVLAALATLVSHVTGATLPDHDKLLVSIILIFVNVLPFSLVLYFFGTWLKGGIFSEFTKGFCLLTAAFGTYLTAYSTTLNNHTVAAVAILFTLLTGSRIATTPSPSGLSFLACGLLSAWAVANELPAGFFCVLVFVYLRRIDNPKAMKFFVPGVLLVTVLFFGCTFWATGGFVPFYLHKELYNYAGRPPGTPPYLFGTKDSRAVYILNYIVGHHGVISLSPVLLFGLIGMFSRRTPGPLRLGALILTGIQCVFVFFAIHDYAGTCQGPRWFFWLIPIWLFCLPPVVEQLGRSTFGRCVLIESLLWSFGSVCYATFAWPSGPWSVSWLHEWMRYWHLTNY